MVNEITGRLPRRRGAPRKLTEARERRVVLAYYEGKLKVEAIANRFGISRTAVYDMVKRNPHLVHEAELIGRKPTLTAQEGAPSANADTAA
jgi:transposase